MRIHTAQSESMAGCMTGAITLGHMRQQGRGLSTNRLLLLMLSFCWIIVCPEIGNKIRADATLRLGPEAALKGHQGQMILSSMFMFDRFQISSKPNIDS